MRPWYAAMIVALTAALTVACKAAEEDPRPVRPGGTGTGGSGDGPDAAVDDGDGGTGAPVAGEVCVVLDLASPFACPAITQQRDVLVAVVGGDSTRSDTAGGFAVAVTGTSALLELGGELADALVTTRWRASIADSPVHAPVVGEGTWDDALAAVLETQTTGAAIVYVRDGGAPFAGATVTLDGADGGSRRYYDGAGQLDGSAIATGPDGLATFIDVASGEVVVTDGVRTATGSVSTIGGGIGIVVVDLGAP